MKQNPSLLLLEAEMLIEWALSTSLVDPASKTNSKIAVLLLFCVHKSKEHVPEELPSFFFLANFNCITCLFVCLLVLTLSSFSVFKIGLKVWEISEMFGFFGKAWIIHFFNLNLLRILTFWKMNEFNILSEYRSNNHELQWVTAYGFF